METVKVYVGTATELTDRTRPVEFEGEELAEHAEFGDHKGRPSDTRGVIETLYRAVDGRLVVHVKDWSNWVGEANVYTLQEVTEDDLGPNGRFWAVGSEAGFGRPLNLDEVLAQREDVEDY